MKVHELIEILRNHPSGLEVVLSSPNDHGRFVEPISSIIPSWVIEPSEPGSMELGESGREVIVISSE